MSDTTRAAEFAESLEFESGDQLSVREVVLLWLAEARWGIDQIEAFEYVFREPELCEVGTKSTPVDAVLVRTTDDAYEVVIVLYRDAVARALIEAEIASLNNSGDAVSLLRTLGQQSKQISRILQRAKVPLRADLIRLEVAVVAPGERLVLRGQSAGAISEVSVFDEASLQNLRNAVSDPEPLPDEILVRVNRADRISTRAGRFRVVVAIVGAEEVLNWPGIQDRRLFDLNVRLSLGKNRVRHSLDEAFATRSDHPEILGYHNGLTVISRQIDDSDESSVRLSGVSIVNGAQTVLALWENASAVSPELRLLVKFVEVSDVLRDAQEIAVRSNSQNPVTTRNLRALDEVQIRLRKELALLGLNLETRTDRGRRNLPGSVENDLVAQLLCGIYLGEPWLAVKRTSLFRKENYDRIFSTDIPASHVVLVVQIRQRVENSKAIFDENYHRAWRLTMLTACYLVGQVLHSSPEYAQLLRQGSSTPTSESTAALVDRILRTVSEVLNGDDYSLSNYYIGFKSKKDLLRLSADVVRRWMQEGTDA